MPLVSESLALKSPQATTAAGPPPADSLDQSFFTCSSASCICNRLALGTRWTLVLPKLWAKQGEGALSPKAAMGGLHAIVSGAHGRTWNAYTYKTDTPDGGDGQGCSQR